MLNIAHCPILGLFKYIHKQKALLFIGGICCNYTQIGDSNIRGYVHNMKSLLKENYEPYSVIKPGATTNELQETARKESSKLTCMM